MGSFVCMRMHSGVKVAKSAPCHHTKTFETRESNLPIDVILQVNAKP